MPSSIPTEWNDNIRADKKSIFIMEVYQIPPNGTPLYKKQAIEVSSSGTATVSAIGGNGTYNSHTNSSTTDKVILGFVTGNPQYPTYIRIEPIYGEVEILG